MRFVITLFGDRDMSGDNPRPTSTSHPVGDMISNSTLNAQREDAKAPYPHIPFPMFPQLNLTSDSSI